jgi:uncharacterized membrane protein YvbJ
MFCPSCGSALTTPGRFCVQCGAPVAATRPAAVPVTVVSAPLRRTAAQQGDYITGVAGRIGCNLLIGFILFKIAVLSVVILGLVLLALFLRIL